MKTYVMFYTSVSIHPVSHPIWPNKTYAALNTINRVIREHLAAEIKLPPNLTETAELGAFGLRAASTLA